MNNILHQLAKESALDITNHCKKSVNNFSEQLAKDKIKNLDENERWMLLFELILFGLHMNYRIILSTIKSEEKSDFFMESLLKEIKGYLLKEYMGEDSFASFWDRFVDVFKRDQNKFYRDDLRLEKTMDFIKSFCMKICFLLHIPENNIKSAFESTEIIASCVMDLCENLWNRLKKEYNLDPEKLSKEQLEVLDIMEKPEKHSLFTKVFRWTGILLGIGAIASLLKGDFITFIIAGFIAIVLMYIGYRIQIGISAKKFIEASKRNEISK